MGSKKNFITHNLKLTLELAEKLEELSALTGRNMSDIEKTAVDEYVRKELKRIKESQ